MSARSIYRIEFDEPKQHALFRSNRCDFFCAGHTISGRAPRGVARSGRDVAALAVSEVRPAESGSDNKDAKARLPLG